MYQQAGSAPSGIRHFATGILAAIVLVAIAVPAIAQEEPEETTEMMELRGIFMNPGDTASTAILPVGDEDMFVFDALADSELEIEVRAVGESRLMPGLELLAPDGSSIDISSDLKEKKSRVRVRLVLDDPEAGLVTGRYGFIVKGRSESEGEYKVKLTVTPPKKRKEVVSLKQLQLANIRFGAGPDSVIKVSIKSKGGPVYVVHVRDGAGFAIPGAERLFEETSTGELVARLYPTQNAGDYYIGIRGNVDVQTQVTVKIRTKHTPPIKRHREITSEEPTIDQLNPDTGFPGNGIVIEGSNFLPGTIKVLFNGVESPGAFYVDFGKINVIVPWQPDPEEGEEPVTTVDVTVYNPDGQSVTKEMAFTYD